MSSSSRATVRAVWVPCWFTPNTATSLTGRCFFASAGAFDHSRGRVRRGGGPGGGDGGGGDDEPPEFDRSVPTTVSIPETTDSSDTVGAPITATGSNPLRYSLTGEGAELFAIGATTGQITLRAGVELDFETGPTTFTLTVVATDTVTNGTVESQVTITITDVTLPGKANDYDTNNDETLDLDETLVAVADYIEEDLTIIRTYLQA